MLRCIAVVAVCLAALLATPAAMADTAPIAADAAAPGTDPTHQTPLEVLASRIASHIAGASASVRCEGSTNWASLTAAGGLDPADVLGFVAEPSDYYPSTDTWASSSTVIELSPTACAALQAFAQATTKPTMCEEATNTYVTSTAHRYVTRVRRIRVNGVLTRIRRRVLVPYQVTTLVQTRAPPAPCFLGAASADSAVCAQNTVPSSCFTAASSDSTYWRNYEVAAEAILTLAHEPIHVWQDQVGRPIPADSLVEAQATCYGMQWMPYVAEQLGATADDAQSIADYFWKVDYPGLQDPPDAYSQSHPYWSAACVPGGALDIRASASAPWP